MSSHIQVAVRMRPFISNEPIRENPIPKIDFDLNENTIKFY